MPSGPIILKVALHSEHVPGSSLLICRCSRKVCEGGGSGAHLMFDRNSRFTTRMAMLESTKRWQATPQVAVDICAAFGIEEEGVFRTTSYRSK